MNTVIVVAIAKTTIRVDAANSGITTPLKVRDNSVTGVRSPPKKKIPCSCVDGICNSMYQPLSGGVAWSGLQETNVTVVSEVMSSITIDMYIG